MRYAVISDLHANREALFRVIRDAREQNVQRFICLGDVVGYGPQPGETMALLRGIGAVVIAGNHDDAVSGRLHPEAFIDLAADAVRRHREALTAEDLRLLAALPYTYTGEDFVAAHGDFAAPRTFAYVDDEEVARRNFAAVSAQLLFVGHTHVPCLFLTGGSGTVYRLPPQDFTLEEGKRYIVNPGSVGYPREAEGKCLSTYVIFDSDARTVEWRSLPFSVASVLQRGTGPRIWGQTLGRFKRTLVAVLAAIAVAVAGLTAYLVSTRVTVSEDPALVVHARRIVLSKGAALLVPNLKLERDSAPVTLRIAFLDAGGETMRVEPVAVRQSSMKRVRIPSGAAQAELKLIRARASDQVRVASFAPSLLKSPPKVRGAVEESGNL